jgi:uncharacterized protein (DUF302 family)
MSNPGIINVACNESVMVVADRLESLLSSKGMKIFLRLDQAAEAGKVGLPMRPMVLLIFGDPKAGTPLMIQRPSLAVDLPLKALVWESDEGKVWISYNSPEYLQQRHGLEQPPFGALNNLFQIAASQGKTSSAQSSPE